MKHFSYFLTFILCLLTTGCYSPKVLTYEDFQPVSTSIDSVVTQLPDNYDDLSTVKGEGKAIVSEPNNSSHITLNFRSNREKSLITIKNNLGIEGGKILSTQDSLIIYNRIDKYVRIVPVGQGQYSRVNNLASVNIVDILSIPVNLSEAEHIFENEELYLIALPAGTKVYIGKENFRVQQIDQSPRMSVTWSRIIYDGYDEIKGFSIPRRITIFSADGSSKVSLLVQGLSVNPDLGELKINIPEDIPVYRE